MRLAFVPEFDEFPAVDIERKIESIKKDFKFKKGSQDFTLSNIGNACAMINENTLQISDHFDLFTSRGDRGRFTHFTFLSSEHSDSRECSSSLCFKTTRQSKAKDFRDFIPTISDSPRNKYSTVIVKL
jgi:hypothetical protein